jgi:predicted adenine nucleotide alpha hydrolase (AANH) superfamily ATPase
MCIRTLRDEGIEPSLYWHNPNIHPYMEYVRRRDALAAYAKDLDLSLIMEDRYGLRDFLDALYRENAGPSKTAGRCALCYRLRMEKTAKTAAEKGFEAFSTTLLISPYQDQRLIGEEGETAARRYGVRFLYRDFRPRFREGQAGARALGIYMQKYCGCVFSEEERYLETGG